MSNSILPTKINFRQKKTTQLKIEPPSCQQSFDTRSSSKYASVTSKYSMSKNSSHDRILTEALQKHGSSILYNFKFKNIMKSYIEPEPKPDLRRLPTLQSPTVRNIETNTKTSFFREPPSATERPDSSSTKQLRARITKFLQPTNELTYAKAMETFENEIAQFKQKHKQQREQIFTVLPVTEADIIEEGITSLVSKNIKKKFPARNFENQQEIPIPERSDFRVKALTNKALPKTLTLRTLAKEYVKEEPPESFEAPKASIVSYTPKGMFSGEKTLTKLSAKLEYESPKPVTLGGTPKTFFNGRSSSRRFDAASTLNLTNSTISGRRNPGKGQAKRKFIDAVKKLVKKMNMIGLTMAEIVDNKVFPSAPYEREGALSLFKMVKANDYDGVFFLLGDKKYLVYDHDPTKLTPLHWAAKRGYSRLVKLLLENGADPDARDISGRTALILAVKGGYLVCVKLLLWFRANPFMRSDGGKIAVEFTKDEEIKRVLRKGHKMHLILELCSPKKFKEKWQDVDKKDFDVKESELV